MLIQEFLKTVWSEQGYYCIVGKDQQNIISPKFIKDIADADNVIQKMLQDKQDVYFACSTFHEPKDRTKANAKEERILWLDIDCGYDEKKGKWKDYESKDDALVALRKFTDTTQLPEPMIVDSGRGIHCYWPFIEPVDKAIWTPVAEGLKFLCAKHGLKADAACTADAARILRVPNTKNFKDITKPEDVKILIEGKPTAFDELASLIPIHITNKPKAKRAMDPATKAILGNNSAKFKKIVDKCIKGDGCAQLMHIITKQASIEEPLWRSGLSIAAFCSDADSAIHNISKRHPDYTFDKTEDKARAIPGPHTCTQFESLRPVGCEGCKYKGSITSPIELGKVILRSRGADNVVKAKSEEFNGEEVSIQIPDYPHPYFRGKNGGIYIESSSDSEEGIMIYDYDLYLVDRLKDNVLGECAWFKLHLPHDGVADFIAPLSQLLSKEECRKILNEKGVIRYGKRLEAVIEYIAKTIDVEQKKRKASHMYKQYGWNAELNKVLIGNREVSAWGTKYVPVTSDISDITTTLTKKGSYEEWKKGIAVYERPGMELRAFGFFCAFGSLLMPFFESKEKSAVINLYNPESGQGKTTILQAMTSVFGNPDTNAKLINVWGDTANSITHRLGVMNSLPTAVDEFTNVHPDALHEFLKFVAMGRGKNRLTSNGSTNKERPNDTVFNLICVVSSNTDFKSVAFARKAKASGEMARFFQILIEEDTSMSKTEADTYFSRIMDNYGHAGEIYAQWVIANVEMVKKALKQTQIEIDTKLNIKGVDRKYSATLAAVFLGAKIARSLGIHNIDIKNVQQAIANEFLKSRKDTQDRDFNAIETLGEFLRQNYKNTLVINSIVDHRSGVSEAPVLKPVNELNVRIEPDTHLIYIPIKTLKVYLKKVNVEYDDFMKGMKYRGALHAKSGDLKTLHKGLDISGPAERCLWIDNTFFEEITANAN